MVKIIRNSFLTIYRQVAGQLMSRIDKGDLKPGMKLPPESGLARRFGIHRNTARKALDLLRSYGMIVYRKKKGNFVSEKNIINKGG